MYEWYLGPCIEFLDLDIGLDIMEDTDFLKSGYWDIGPPPPVQGPIFVEDNLYMFTHNHVSTRPHPPGLLYCQPPPPQALTSCDE